MITTVTEVEILEFDPQTATEAEWIALADLRNTLQAERLPDDPPRTLAQRQAQLRNVPAMFAVFNWAAWAGEPRALVGSARLVVSRTEENQHLAQLEVEVLPAWRRRGVGRQLLAAACARAGVEGRRLLLSASFGALPAGAAFLARIGGTLALAGHINQLDLADLDRGLLERWQAAAAERAAGFVLGGWDGPYPEADLPEIVALNEAANLQPHGDLDVEDFHLTGDQLRQHEAYMAARGEERWTLYVRAPETGELAGFTDVTWNPTNPALLMQGITAVWPKYRGRGLGRLLKAAMLARVLRERPQVRHVRTGNADSNAPMLHINEALGFRPYQADALWQVPLARAQAYLTAT